MPSFKSRSSIYWNILGILLSGYFVAWQIWRVLTLYPTGELTVTKWNVVFDGNQALVMTAALILLGSIMLGVCLLGLTNGIKHRQSPELLSL